MPLIDKSYFIEGINIPNTGDPAVAERLNYTIHKREAELLDILLGRDLYASYQADAGTPRMEELIDGAGYTVEGKDYVWPGLRSTVVPAGASTPAYKKSIIANYVYYWWMRQEVMPKSDDAATQAQRNEDKSRLMVAAWNEICDELPRLAHFLESNRETFPEWDVTRSNLYRYFAPINSMNL